MADTPCGTPTIGDLIDEAIFKKQQGDEFVIRFKGQMLSGFGGDMDIVRDKTEGVANVKGNMAKQILGGLMMKAFEMGEAASSADRDRLRERVDTLSEALDKIVQWADAYPKDVFTPPDYERIRETLHANGHEPGHTLDGISADCMRHCMKGAGDIAREALQSTGGA